jgi:hypothetical protein
MDQPHAFDPAGLDIADCRQHDAVDAGPATRGGPGRGTELIIGFDDAGFAVYAGLAGLDNLAVGVAFQFSLLVDAGVLDLLEQQDPVLECGQQCVEVAIRRTSTSRLVIATNDQRASHAAGDLQRRRTMPMRVVPERSRRMIRRDIVFVLEADLWIYRQQHIVTVAGWARPQAMTVQVRAIETMGSIRVTTSAVATGIFRQLIMQSDANGIPRLGVDRRRDEGQPFAAGISFAAGVNIAAQVDFLILASSGVLILAAREIEENIVGVFNGKVIVYFALPDLPGCCGAKGHWFPWFWRRLLQACQVWRIDQQSRLCGLLSHGGYRYRSRKRDHCNGTDRHPG